MHLLATYAMEQKFVYKSGVVLYVLRIRHTSFAFISKVFSVKFLSKQVSQQVRVKVNWRLLKSLLVWIADVALNT